MISVEEQRGKEISSLSPPSCQSQIWCATWRDAVNNRRTDLYPECRKRHILSHPPRGVQTIQTIQTPGTFPDFMTENGVSYLLIVPPDLPLLRLSL